MKKYPDIKWHVHMFVTSYVKLMLMVQFIWTEYFFKIVGYVDALSVKNCLNQALSTNIFSNEQYTEKCTFHPFSRAKSKVSRIQERYPFFYMHLPAIGLKDWNELPDVFKTVGVAVVIDGSETYKI